MNIADKVKDRSLVVGILGMGYVGVPLALALSQAGFRVVGFDVLDVRVRDLNAGLSPVKHIPDHAIEAMCRACFEATDNFSKTHTCDVLIICVPTPLSMHREPDLSFVIKTLDQISPSFRAGQMRILESTTWPGTTAEVLLPYVERQGLQTGRDFFLVYSPEREDPGNPSFTTRTIPKIVGGHTAACLSAGVALYETFVDEVVPVSSTQTAEMVKLLENIHRSINIGLVNELKVVADAMNLDIFEVIDAAKTKPFGFTAYYPGPGIGGHCIPIDPFYLTWKAREYGVHTRFIELAGEVNAAMPQYVVEQTMRALNSVGKSLMDARVLVLGVAYKRDVDDMRGSPSAAVMEILRGWGAKLSYADPNVPHFPMMRDYDFDLESVALTPELLSSQDVVLLLTDHSDFDYDLIGEHAPLLIDTRGRFRELDRRVWRA